MFFGCAVSIFLYFGANSLRSRRLSANAEHLHGSARWATGEDIRETGLLDAGQGVYVGGWKPGRRSRLHYLRHDGPEHVLVFAPTRSGKGVSLVIPTLLAWNESAVIYDIKGENWAKTAGFRSQQGHICFRFCPVEQSYGSRFNPLAEVWLFTERDVATNTMVFRRGFEIQPGETAVVIEDVVTTGGSSLQAIDRIQEFGCEVVQVVAIVDRMEGGAANFAARGLTLKSLLTIEDFGITPPAG